MLPYLSVVVFIRPFIAWAVFDLDFRCSSLVSCACGGTARGTTRVKLQNNRGHNRLFSFFTRDSS